MRACEPDREDLVEVDGFLPYEVYEDGYDPTVLLLPTWTIIPKRFWKAQLAYLARHCVELTAVRTPLVFVPLRNDFEQNHHVAGRRLDDAEADPHHATKQIAEEIGRDVDHRPVEADGAAREARPLADLL